MTEEVIEGADTLWRTTALYMTKIEQFRRSLPFYDRAVAQCPKNKKVYLDRARALNKINKFDAALEDIQQALRLDKNNIYGLTEKAHATYMACEIEQALIQNYRLLPRRKKPDDFELGINYCISALYHSLGDMAGRPLRDHFLIIRKKAWLDHFSGGEDDGFTSKRKVSKKGSTEKKSLSVQNKLKQIAKSKEGDKDTALDIKDSLHSFNCESYLVPRISTPFKFSPFQKYTSNLKNYMAEKYLDRMYRDKVFLKEMKTMKGVTTSNEKGSKKIKEIADDTYRVVSQKQEVLRTRIPFYNIKFQEARVSGTLQLRQDAELHLQQLNCKREAEKFLNNLEMASKEHNLGACIDMVEKVKTFLDSKSKKILPLRDKYSELMYQYIRNAFYKVNRLNETQAKWDQDKRIMVQLDQPISREPSNDSVIDYYSNFNLKKDRKAQIALFEDRLKVATSNDEVCWCYHEISRYYMLLKQLENAKLNAQNCVYAAQAHDQKEWMVNGTVLLIRIQIRLKSKKEALEEANFALNLATKLKDNVLQQYLHRVKHVIQELEFDLSDKKKLEKRQQKILAMMTSPKLKEEFAFLFRSMKTLQREKRASVFSGSNMQLKKGMSEARLKSKKLTKPELESSSSGANFM